MEILISAKTVKSIGKKAKSLQENMGLSNESMDYVLFKIGSRILGRAYWARPWLDLDLKEFISSGDMKNLEEGTSYIVQELTKQGYKVDTTYKDFGLIKVKW